MKQIDASSTRLLWRSGRDIVFSKFLERRAPSRCDSSRGLQATGIGDAESDALDRPRVITAIASTASQLAEAAALVESRYAWRGYFVATDGAAALPGVTLIATEGARTMGTLTLRVDGPAGLAADESYREAIDAVRHAGRRVCEVTRLAIDAAADSRPTLGALIGLAYEVGTMLHGVSDVFVEVNPRHARFYQHTFGFDTAGGRQICPRVRAPAVLLRLQVERLEAKLGELGALARSFARPMEPRAA